MGRGIFFPGDSPEERLAQFGRLTDHVEALWDQAVLLYRQGHRATAGFLSVVVVEELSKLAFLRLEVAGDVTGWHIIPGVQRDEPLSDDVVRTFRRQFTKHRKKQASGMAWAFRINSRVTRLFGDKEAELGRLATAGEMETLRQSLLYIDLTADGFSIPSERDDEVPLTLVCSRRGSSRGDRWRRAFGMEQTARSSPPVRAV